MIPRSFSATALQTAALCLSRYNAEMMHRSKGAPNIAAQTGSAVHGALEPFVIKCYIEQVMEPTLDLLIDFFKMSYVATFGNSDFRLGPFKEGKKMLENWFERTNFSTFTPVTAEVKESFDVPVMVNGVKEYIPFNYIWDRFDDLGDGIYRVTDYKTNIMPLNNDDLRNKPQARCYSMAARIKYPNAKQIWVEFDMLRHQGPVGVVFTREDDTETWRWIRSEAQRIIDTPTHDEDGNPVKIPETLNDECTFCVRKSKCGSVLRNIDVDGIQSMTLEEMVDQRHVLSLQEKAAKKAKEEIDALLTAAAQKMDVDKLPGVKHADMVFRSRGTRSVDGERVTMILAEHPKLIRKYVGGASMRVADYDAMMEDPDLPEHLRGPLAGVVGYNYSKPSPSTKPRPVIGG